MDIARIRQKYPDAQMFTFGDSKSLCDELLALVRAGKKTATCGALTEFEDDPTAMPKVGRTDIAQTWEGEPAVAIRTVSVEIKAFEDVDEAFALQEGEDDDLEGWRRGHRSYFERNGGFDPRMKLVCERFEVVEIF
ncbi:MAG TPA: ASCH domain-containing protein [Pseudohongiella sp.]|nr:ASCH domain-containing protein [Pseudohongiella sp.]HBX37299.1 ASCH domain-containing protein [Pseudohongiella sp.]|tara:strand:- start:617 stop:1024 length:408 start_codon:yes stop_codon:yes gene_type:complete